jgi:Tfp pilus assembly protein PilX
MYNPLLNLKNRKGVALISVYMVLVVLSIFITAFLSRSIYQNRAVMVFKKSTQAFDLAEAGLDKALTWLRAQPSPPIGNYTNPWGGVQNLTLGTYSTTITDLGVQGAVPGIRRYRITSTGTVGTVTRVLTNYLQTDNYARYIWFTDRETYDGSNVWFWTQDTLNGPTHTNGHFNIAGNPTFTGDVRSVDDYIRFYNNGNNVNLNQITNPPYDNPNFQGGFTFGAEQFNMPSQALNLRTASSNGGLRLQGDTTVVLNSNGTMNVTNSNKGWNNKNMALPANGALFVACGGNRCSNGGSLTISGTLNGRLTAGAERDLVVPNSIVYAHDPRTDPTSTDTMGIISEQDVVIRDNAPTNMEIDGAVMALQTSFMLDNWWVGPPKGTLTVYGGIIQDDRGPVGTFNGQTGQKISGYSKSYSYDPRLLNNPPPFFPTTGDYITLSWED